MDTKAGNKSWLCKDMVSANIWYRGFKALALLSASFSTAPVSQPKYTNEGLFHSWGRSLRWVVAFLTMEVHSEQLYPAVMQLLAVVGGRVVGWGWGLGT